jgi:hypothetical protein
MIDASTLRQRLVRAASQLAPDVGPVEADTLREVLLDPGLPTTGMPWTIRRAQIEGELNLSDSRISAPLEFIDCKLVSPANLAGLSVPRLSIVGCDSGGIIAPRLTPIVHEL